MKNDLNSSFLSSLTTKKVLHNKKKQGSRTEPILTFGLNVTTQNLHSVQLFANTKRINFRVFFLIFEVGLRSSGHRQNR